MKVLSESTKTLIESILYWDYNFVYIMTKFVSYRTFDDVCNVHSLFFRLNSEKYAMIDVSTT